MGMFLDSAFFKSPNVTKMSIQMQCNIERFQKPKLIYNSQKKQRR